MHNFLPWYIFLIMILGHTVVYGQESTYPSQDIYSTNSISLHVYFRQDVSRLEPAYRNNYLQLENFVQQVRTALADSSYVMQDISIYASASPEGSYNHNKQLSQDRGAAICHYLKSSFNFPDSVFIIHAIGEDWEGLRDLSLKYNVPHCDEIVNIIDNIPLFTYDKTGALVDSRKKHLMELRGGTVWNYLLEHIFSELRSGNNNIVCHFRKVVPETHTMVVEHYPDVNTPVSGFQPATIGLTPEQEALLHRLDSLSNLPQGPQPAAAVQDTIAKIKKPFRQYYVRLGTNMLYDLALSPNVELEFPIGKRFSLMLEHWFPWWIFGNDKHALEVLYSGGELRCWLGNRRNKSVLQGTFLGVYGGATEYDLEYNEKGYQGESVLCAGLTLGKSWRLSKHWRMEMSLSVGYLHTDYRYYEHNKTIDLLIWQHDGSRDWIGPTKFKLSLGWLIGMKKTKKGGAR